jgi:RNA polymerase sigma-70 factor (ECF subfamily)
MENVQHSYLLVRLSGAATREALLPETVARAEESVSVTARTPAEIESQVLAAYESFAASLFRYSRALSRDSQTAEDTVQEVFLRYYLALVRGDKILSGKAWLFRVARNYLLDRAKEYAARNCVSLGECAADALPDAQQNPEADQQRAEMLRRALAQLSSRETECLRLRAEGLNYQEIAHVLNLRTGTVGTLLARGLKKIREAVTRYREGR